MSVFVVSEQMLNAIYNKAISYKDRKVCDINYCHPLSDIHPDVVKAWIKQLYKLNLQSFNRRYKRRDKVQFFVDALELRSTPQPNIDTYQMLKFCNCLHYNIEVGVRGADVKFLERVISDIQENIIAHLPEYKDAQWSVD